MVLSVLDLKRLLTAVSVQILIQSKCASCLFFTNFWYFKLCCCAQIHKKINWMRPKTLTASAGFYSRLKIFFEAKFPFYVRTMHGFTYFM